MSGQHNDPPDQIQVNGETEWEVDNILAVRKRHSKLQYRIEWLGYDDDPDWYPASDVKYAPHKVRDFHLANPTRPEAVDKLTLDSCCRPILVVRAAGANQEVADPGLSMTDLIQVGPPS
jgi:hypothetical protein